MGRTTRVTDDELNNDYLDTVSGVENDSADEETRTNEGTATQEAAEDESGGDEALEERARLRDQSGSGTNAAAKTGTPDQNKSGQANKANGTANNAADSLKLKANLTDEQTKAVYHALKDRIQPVIYAQDQKIQKLTGENRELTAKVQAYDEMNSFARQYSLTPAQQLQGMQIIAALQKDPQATINYLIDKMQASGQNVAINKVGDAALSPSAVRQMITETLAPLLNEQRGREDQIKIRDDAAKEVEQFYGDFPDARIHEKELSEAITRFPQLSLPKALYQLRQAYASNGWDWNRPLHEVMNTQTQQQTQQRPMNMRGNTGTVQPTQNRQEEDEDAPLPANTPLRDIIKANMRRAGMNVDNL